MSKTSPKPKISEAFHELESITQEFEAGDLDLEKSIPKFKKAVELSKYLKKRLTQLENQIEEIDIDFNGDQQTD